MCLIFTYTPGESYCRWLRSLLLCLCDVFHTLINSLMPCWFCMSTLGLVQFQITIWESLGKTAFLATVGESFWENGIFGQGLGKMAFLAKVWENGIFGQGLERFWENSIFGQGLGKFGGKMAFLTKVWESLGISWLWLTDNPQKRTITKN